MKHPIRRCLTFLLSLLLLALTMTTVGCSSSVEEYRDFTYFAMDTYVTLRLARKDANGKPLSDEYLAVTAAQCSAILDGIEGVISAHDPKSDLYALNSGISKMLRADERLVSMLDIADKIANLTDGAYDYTLGTLTELWNVAGGGPVPTEKEIEKALSHTGRDKVTIDGSTITKIDKESKIDFGGIGKGAAAQAVLEYLNTTDVPYGIVSIGGNIGVYGKKPEYSNYKIGIRDPDTTDTVLGYYYLPSGFLSVSGDYERFFEENGVRYHHILDGKTGAPADSGLRCVAVHSANGSAADALSTALFVMGVEESLALYEEGKLSFEAIFVTDMGEIITTPGITADHLEITADGYTVTHTEKAD